jgi:hypothetical protein
MGEGIICALQKSLVQPCPDHHFPLALGGRCQTDHHVLCLHCWIHWCLSFPGKSCSIPIPFPSLHAVLVGSDDSPAKFNRCFTTSTQAHILSLFSAGVLGFSVGCILHALPMTASFVYIDVSALVLASIAAAILTTVWVQKSPYSMLFSDDVQQPNTNSPNIHKQRKLSAESELRDTTSFSSLASSTRSQIRFGDNSAVSEIITNLLNLAMERPNHFASFAPWSTKLIQTAIEKWTDGSIILVLSNRQVFDEVGLEDCWSISENSKGILRVAAGFLDAFEVELYLSRFNQALAHLSVHLIGIFLFFELTTSVGCANLLSTTRQLHSLG